MITDRSQRTRVRPQVRYFVLCRPVGAIFGSHGAGQPMCLLLDGAITGSIFDTAAKNKGNSTAVEVVRPRERPCQSPSFFENELLPDGTELAGWAALVALVQASSPVRHPSCLPDKHVRGNKGSEDPWEIHDKRYQPEPSPLDHLTFALRQESIDLLILKRGLGSPPTLRRSRSCFCPMADGKLTDDAVKPAKSIINDAFQNGIA